MGTFIGHRSSSTNNAGAASSSNGVLGSYTSGYGHSGYGCCCCDKEEDGGGGLFDDQGLLALLGLGAAAVFFLNMQITMATKKRRRSFDPRLNLGDGEEGSSEDSWSESTADSVVSLFNSLVTTGK